MPHSFRLPRQTLATLGLATALLGGCAAMSYAAPAGSADGVLVNPAGMTLYTFDRDVQGNGKSACNGPCATLWPPFMADAQAQAQGDFTVVMRDDGQRQWAHKGKPLYLWSRDAKPGDKTGDGFNNVWRLARP